MTEPDDGRPRWSSVSATFRTQGAPTEEGRQLLLGDERPGPTTRVSWRCPAEDGRRFTEVDAARLAGARVDAFSLDFGGGVQEYGPGVILVARVIEDGAAMWLVFEG